MEALTSGELTIDVRLEARRGVLRLDWRGKSMARQPGSALRPFFDRVVEEAHSAGADLEMHFEAIEHFNSATIRELIRLIKRLREENIRLAVVYDARLQWQRLSFDALRVFETPAGLLRFVALEG